MKKPILLALAVIALAAIFVRVASAQDGGVPPPTSGTALDAGLSATGAAIGPDGALYVATVGTGGAQVLTPPPEAGFEGEVTFGTTATVVRVEDDGTTTTVAENLPSLAVDGEGQGAIADVEFIGTTMYFALTGSLDKIGAPDWPNGVYRVTNNGTDADLMANISAYNDSHPVEFEDAIPGGNPFALERRGSGFVVSDGNYNRLLSVQANGVITALSEFANVVPTGLASGPSGSILNTWFSPAPHLPGESFVVSVDAGGNVTELASGPVSMIDVSIGPNGNTYVLQFSDFVADETAPPQPTGRIYQLEGSELTLLVDGMILPTSLNFSGDTAFVTSLTGAVYVIPNFSDIDPLPAPAASPTAPAASPTAGAPAATPTRTGSIGAPDTGDGSAAGGSGSVWLIVVTLSAVGAALAIGGTRLARNHR